MPKPKALNIPPMGAKGRPVTYKVQFPPEISEDLKLYVKAYEENYDQTIDVSRLIAHIVTHKLKSDRAFRKFKKEQGSSANAEMAHS